jgi:uncharacterized protein
MANHPQNEGRRFPNVAAPQSPPMKTGPLGDAEIDELQRLLDAVPAPLEPLDVSALDGYLCGVVLQPTTVAPARWVHHVHDIDGRPAPPGLAPERLHALVRRRHAELEQAISQRRWFDPWVYELDAQASPSDAVLSWVAGFAMAMEHFPQLLQRHEAALVEPLALIYRHIDAADLDDADELLAEIEALEPPADLAEAVEGLVRATLLIADVSRPLPVARSARRSNPRRRP